MNRIQTLTASDWGPSLHRAARVVGTVAAFLITIALVAGGCAYSLGRQLRLAIEARNDQIAAWWVGVLRLTPAFPAAPGPEPAAAPVLLLSASSAPIALLCPAAVPARPTRAPRQCRPAAAPTAPAPKPRNRKPKAPTAPKARKKVAA